MVLVLVGWCLGVGVGVGLDLDRGPPSTDPWFTVLLENLPPFLLQEDTRGGGFR